MLLRISKEKNKYYFRKIFLKEEFEEIKKCNGVNLMELVDFFCLAGFYFLLRILGGYIIGYGRVV